MEVLRDCRVSAVKGSSRHLSLSLFLWFWGLFFFWFCFIFSFLVLFQKANNFPGWLFCVCVCVCVCLCVLDEGPVRWTSGARSPANESLPLFFPFRSVPPGPSPPFSFNSSPSVSLTNDNEERNNRTIVWIQNAVTNSIRCRNCISHRRPSWLGLATHRTGHLIGCRLLAGFLQIPSINPCSDVFFFVCFFFCRHLTLCQSKWASSVLRGGRSQSRSSVFQGGRDSILKFSATPTSILVDLMFSVISYTRRNICCSCDKLRFRFVAFGNSSNL